MHLTTFLKTWWRAKMESKKQLRYIFHCVKYGDGGRLLVTCGEASLLSTGSGYSSPAPPEAGIIMDVCSGKQMHTATLLGEERRALLQPPHMFLCQRNARECLWGNTGGWHGLGESWRSAQLLPIRFYWMQIWLLHQGKTLTTIALILTNFHGGNPLPVETCVSEAQQFFVSHCPLIKLCVSKCFMCICAGGQVFIYKGQSKTPDLISNSDWSSNRLFKCVSACD